MTQKIKILVVDDSAFMRKAISQMIKSDSAFEVVGTAKNGLECIEKVKTLNPDIVTLDIEMPKMDGLEALKVILKTNPRLAVVMLSSLTVDAADATLEALDLGALDFIDKKLCNLSFNILNRENELKDKLKAISSKKLLAKRKMNKLSEKKINTDNKKRQTSLSKNIKNSGKIEIIAIGSSTGGPKALKDILEKLPATISAGIVIVQHMPPLFITQFAERINQICNVYVKEAEKGDIVEPGKVLIAPGGIHLELAQNGNNKKCVNLVKIPTDLPHKPSVDIMMHSVAKNYSNQALAVILTGMGNDGMHGIKNIKEKNGVTIAQDEESCIVYGMPKAAVDCGAINKILPLSLIADEIISICEK